MSSLRSICESETHTKQLLYACALDAQEVGHRKVALMALRMILDNIEIQSYEHLPALLRCTIKLTMTEIESTSYSATNVDSLCALYEKGESGIAAETLAYYW